MMASPKELISGLAVILDIPAETLTVHDRNLAEVGIRQKAKPGRGSGGNRVTAEDAASLIVAAIASQKVKDSASTVRALNSHVRQITRLLVADASSQSEQGVTIPIKKNGFLSVDAKVTLQAVRATAAILER